MYDDFRLAALEAAAAAYGTSDIFNTGQGGQFTGTALIDVLKREEIETSMNGSGRWMDNVFIERL